MELVDFREIREGGDEWEAFSRDFLVALGFAVETPPGRGADGGRDLLIIEHLSGTLNKYPFRWLVSCKHRAHSGKSVNEGDEPNILERLASFRADGFVGVYSTLPSSGLIERLRALSGEDKIRDYKLFDARLIENHLVRLGYSQLLLRYFPNSYRQLKPLHQFTEKYLPLSCHECGKDLLVDVHSDEGIVVIARPLSKEKDPHIKHVYWVCKGRCDEHLTDSLRARGLDTGWEDLSDLSIPTWYLRWIFTAMNRLRDGKDIYTDEAFTQWKDLVMSLAQRVLREMTEEEEVRVRRMLSFPGVTNSQSVSEEGRANMALNPTVGRGRPPPG
jgi:hypothetical protein